MNDGGPAFPVVHAIIPQPGHFTRTPPAKEGISIHDYFAAKAMQGLLSGPRGENFSVNPIECAEDAMRIADAMLAAREGKTEPSRNP